MLVLQGLFVRIAPLSSSEAPLAPKLDRARVATCTCAGMGIARLKPDLTVYRRDARAATFGRDAVDAIADRVATSNLHGIKTLARFNNNFPSLVGRRRSSHHNLIARESVYFVEYLSDY